MKKLKTMIQWPPLASVLLLLALIIFGAFTISYLFRPAYLASIVQNYAPMILISIGLGAVIIGGGIDLAIGTIASLVNVIVMLLTVVCGMNPWAAILIGIAAGILCGLLNGSIIAFFRINPLISSFAFSWVTGGIALWLVPNPNQYPSAADFVAFYESAPLRIPVSVCLIMIAMAVWYLILKTEMGLQIYATGNNIRKTYVTGVNVIKVSVATYMFSGFCAALAGIAITGSMGGGFATVGGTLTIKGIAACVIGGIALTGGVGVVSGAVSGGLFLAMLTVIVVSTSIDPYYQGLLTNFITLLSILIPSIVGAYRKRIPNPIALFYKKQHKE